MDSDIVALVRYAAPVLSNEGRKPGGYGVDGRRKQGVPTAEILKSVIPTREWEDNGKKWVQAPSTAPSTRLDVINLQEQLEQQLVARRARDTGVCAVRQDLYSQVFDELMREITVDSPERGVLMLRVRDDLRQTVDAYRVMYESSIAFGTRKAAQAELGKDELQAKIKVLEERVDSLEQEHTELQLKCEEVARVEKEKGRDDKVKFDEEMKYLKNANNQVCLYECVRVVPIPVVTQLASLLNTMLHGKSK